MATPDLTETAFIELLAAARSPIASHPVGFLVPPFAVDALRIMDRAEREQWNRRRVKRELRKGSLSTYSKGQSA